MATVVIAPKAATLPYGNNNLAPWIVTYEYAIRRARLTVTLQVRSRCVPSVWTVSPRCDLSVEENLRRFEEMKNAKEFGQTCCLCAKTLVHNPNKTLRDPVIYRYNLIPHARAG
ncbi:hypothetical protein BGZ65_010649, partial [Modicella reniformis]